MTSYEFEKAAKNAVCKVLDDHGIKVSLDQLQFVWFAHILGNKKCLLYCREMGNLYAEVTYNADIDNEGMYVDIYQKVHNSKVEVSEFNFSADKEKEE